ncbi:endonuclease/exonuclease/phosphatase family protein [Pseudidiomarina sp.]|uniref:endonuclease/exonuclease/phosphatase family protein n=1 Tax=Pseudidiomarina sp. TaxID=2081707 RepID=UPI00299DB440|nr:endonuclease/exonuclease/phosphatase family protein [Pseudidiomarina sp.]MDX1705389.1 endonuclease/exonuclease/phosphatase family protein [Pseudidiomarina sp.]
MLANWIITGFTLLLLITTLLPLTRKAVWWARLWDFPRLQQAVVALALLIASGFWLDPGSPYTWTLIGVQLFCGAWQLWWIFPYTVFGKREVARYKRGHSGEHVDEHLRILVVNVFQYNRNAVGLVRMINQQRPDVVVVVEADKWWMEQLTDIEDDYAHILRQPQTNSYGMLVYSVWPFKNEEIEFLVHETIPSMHFDLEMPGGRQVRMHCLHPSPPSIIDPEKTRKRDVELLKVADKTAEESGPVIVTGDLNDVAWSHTTRQFLRESKLLDPRLGRGIYNTYHARFPLLRWPLDHIFHSEHFMLVEIKRLRGFGSDHFPLLVELALRSDD